MNISIEGMSSRAEEAELFLKSLANSRRLMILCTLAEKEMSVNELNQLIPLSQSALSQHLAKLREANFVSTRKVSQTVYYQLADERVKTIIEAMYQVFCADQA